MLIFSKDRAAQLDLLLRSIESHAPSLYSTITVLWKASDAEYGEAYETCFQEHRHFVRGMQQTIFAYDVRKWISPAGPLVSFLVDDDVFYRDCPIVDTAAYHRRHATPWSLRGGDYDYPFSVDGNIYRTHHVEDHLSLIHFNDPTELEAFAHEAREWLPFSIVRPVLPPCLVGVPANRVSLNSGMPHMGVDPRMLNDAFLRGERLECVFDRDTYPAHWPIEYRLVVPA